VRTGRQSYSNVVATQLSPSDHPRAAAHAEEVALLSFFRSLNLLLIGRDEVTRAFLAGLMSSLATPVVYWDDATPTLSSGAAGSLIVRNCARLSRASQQRLLEWLKDHRGRIIATSTRPVFPRVERGLFSDGLYYRINTVTLLLNPRSSRSQPANEVAGRLTEDHLAVEGYTRAE
jgi:transcriptional regulator of acetoin/glycerol metabolism